MEWTRFRLALVTVAVLAVAGCAGLGPLGSEDGSVDKGAIIEAIEETETYKFERRQYRQAAALNETITLRGAIDRADRKARLTRTFGTGSPTGESAERQYYFDATVEYAKEDGGWERVDHDDPQWAEFDYLQEIGETLERGELVRLRSETVAGTETTLFRVDLSAGRIDEIVGVNQSGHVPTVVQEFEYYVYIDADEQRLSRVEHQAVVTQGQEPVTITVKTTFSGQDDPVAITVPEAARTAGSD